MEESFPHKRQRVGDPDIDLLLIAVQDGNVDGVKEQLDKGVDINQVMTNGIILLHYAVFMGHLDIVKLLLGRGANIDQATPTSVTALHMAASKNHLEVMKLLFQHGASAELVPNNGLTALHIATHNDHKEVAQFLLELGVNANLKTNFGATSLHFAAQNGSVGVVARLLQLRAEVNAEIQKGPLGGHNALTLASQSGHLEVVKLLLEHGADPNRQTILAQSALHLAAQHKNLEVVKLLLQWGANYCAARGGDGANPLHIASHIGDSEMVQLLLERGVDINSSTPIGRTPLHFACGDDHRNVVRLLLERGADVNRTSNSGFTPLCIASRKGHIEVAKVLLDGGANLRTKPNSSRNTPLQSAIYIKANIDMVKLLVEHGAPVDDPAALVRAASCNMFEVVAYLVEKWISSRAVVDIKSHLHALQQTLKADRLDITELLAYSYPQLASLYNNSLQFLAASKHNKSESLLSFFIQNGANVNYSETINIQGITASTALHFAVLNKHPNKVWTLMLHGANANMRYRANTTGTVWNECKDQENNTIKDALLHFWTPKTHKFHPIWVKDAILCLLLVAKQQRWPFDRMLMHKIASYVAYGWYCSNMNSMLADILACDTQYENSL